MAKIDHISYGGTNYEIVPAAGDLRDIVAPEFSDQSTYTAGQMVLKNGVLYRFTAAHTGAWTGTDAVETTVETEIKRESATDEQVQNAVDNWLDEHPEVTTTVEDNSLTYRKLVNGTLGFVTPEMYGAVGDGVTDDTDAIQDAINSGFCVYFDKDYIVSDAISISGSCTLIGNKKHFIKQITDDTNLFAISEADNVVIDSLHLIGVGTDYQPQAGGKPVPYGLKIFGTSESHIATVRVSNCLVEKFSHADISVIYADSVVISNNTVVGTGVDGSMEIGDNYQFGIHSNNCSNVRIINNDISYTAQGLYLGKNLHNLIVKGNVIHDITGQHGIYSTYADGYMIVDNTFRNISLAGAKLQHDNNTVEDSKNILVMGNVFDTVGEQGFMLTTVEDSRSHRYLGVNISSNVFYNCITGIFLSLSEGAVVSNNTYIGATNKISGISLSSNNDTVIQNNKIANSDNGIYARTGAIINNITLIGNILKNAGISFTGASYVSIDAYINNIADSVNGLPNKVVIGKKKNLNIFYAPNTALDTENYNAGDIVLFNNPTTANYLGAVMNASSAWMYFGNYLDYVKYIFNSITIENWTVIYFDAHSEGEHKLVISYSITCNVRGTSKTIGSFTGIPTVLIPSTISLASSSSDGYNLFINSAGAVAASTGTAGTTYTKTVTIIDGVVQTT